MSINSFIKIDYNRVAVSNFFISFIIFHYIHFQLATKIHFYYLYNENKI